MRLTAEKTKRVDIPNDPDGGFINIVALTLDEVERLEEKAVEYSLGEDDASYSVKPYKRANLMSRACLRGWGGLFDIKGNSLKFTKAHIKEAAKFEIIIDGQRKRFLEWVDDEHTAFLEEITKEEEEAVKN